VPQDSTRERPVAEWPERRQHLITYCICKVLLYFRRV